jgi:esterase/lipase
MTNKYIFTLFFSLFLISFTTQSVMATSNGFELITYTTQDNGVIEASFFKGGERNLAVIFAHGAIFNKESWYFLAEKLQSKGIASLSIDFRGYGNSKKGTTNKKSLDILGAIDYLKSKGFNSIAIVGGSMGGAAVLSALNTKNDSVIKKVILLAPAGGAGITSTTIKKLLIVSKDEGLFKRVNTIYNESTQPKELKVYPGSYHAQHMFKSDYKNDLISLIIEFLNAPE